METARIALQCRAMPVARRPFLLAPFLAVPARAEEPLTILSAGAVEAGLNPVLAAFHAETRTPVTVTYATAPTLRRRMQSGDTPDLLIAPHVTIAAVAPLLGEARLTIGQVGVGIAMRRDALDPGIRDTPSLRRALLGAESVVLNRASTGLYMDALFARLGLAERLAERITRLDDGAAVMRHVAAGRGAGEIGFAPVTEILSAAHDSAVRLVGPLPPDVQSHTAYIAAPLRAAGPRLRPLLAWLADGRARALLAAAGVEPAP